MESINWVHRSECPGCKHCYAERMSLRLQAMGQPNYINGFSLALHEHMLSIPLHWKKPRRIFVNSMSDLFQNNVPLDFIKKVFAVMKEASQHQFQVLTKRSDRLLELDKHLDWRRNIWMGVSVENQKYASRIDALFARLMLISNSCLWSHCSGHYMISICPVLTG